MSVFQKHPEQYKEGAAQEDEGQLLSASAISHKVNVRLFRTVWLVVLAMIVIVAAIVASCNLYFYNPNRGISEVYGSDGQLAVDMMAFTELHSPGYSTYSASAQRVGPGSYQVQIQQGNLFQGASENYTVQVVRGKVDDTDFDFSDSYLHLPIMNAFDYREGKCVYAQEDGNSDPTPLPPSKIDQENNIKDLAQLPGSSRASVYVTFSKDLTLNQLSDVYQKWKDNIDFLYAAVACTDGYIPSTTGFAPDSSIAILEKGQVDKEKYPNFQLISPTTKADDVTVWSKHFDSLLRYMTTRSSFIETMASINGNRDAASYQNMLDYVNKNGMNIYGVLIMGNKKDVLAFLNQTPYLDFYVSGVRLSKFPS